MRQVETMLPKDELSFTPIQVGSLTTDDSTGSLIKTASLTGTAAAVSFDVNRVYLFSSDVAYHIRVRHDGTTVADATTSSFIVPANVAIPWNMTEDSNISVIKDSTESDGTLTIAPL